MVLEGMDNLCRLTEVFYSLRSAPQDQHYASTYQEMRYGVATTRCWGGTDKTGVILLGVEIILLLI